MKLKSFLMPHPPILVPEVGRGGEKEAQKTLDACNYVGKEIAKIKPETIIFISPHTPLFSDFLFYYDDEILAGNFSRFRDGNVSFNIKQNKKLIDDFSKKLKDKNIKSGSLNETERTAYKISHEELDHGVLVPLYFIKKFYEDFNVFVISSSAFDTKTVYKIGGLLAESIVDTNTNACIIASGDMSHKVNSNSNYGMVKEGGEFDNFIAENIEHSKLEKILNVNPSVRNRAAECGYTAIVMMLGAMGRFFEIYSKNNGDYFCKSQFSKNEKEKGNANELAFISSKLISYEAPFGIGYCIGEFKLASTPVQIARLVINEFVGMGKIPNLKSLPSFNHEPAGCFVTLYKNGELRGCIGTIASTENTIEEEIVRNAIKSATEDYRFNKVNKTELKDLKISVDILGAPEPINSKDELNPEKYGVIVSAGLRRGLLLPMLESVKTVDYQLEIACQKAGISLDEEFTMQRFKVTRYK